jgi:hypothetical protein
MDKWCWKYLLVPGEKQFGNSNLKFQAIAMGQDIK